MSYCCLTLSELIDRAGSDEFSVVAKEAGTFRFFSLQFRALHAEDEGLLGSSKINFGAKRPIHVAGQLAIKYCPFCGANLSQQIENDLPSFKALAEKHKSVVL